MAEGPPPGPPDVRQPAISQRRHPSTALGGLLVLIGAVLLVGQFVRVDVGHYGWPLFVIGPGVLILLIAITARGAVSEGLAILGCVVTVTGLLLMYQNATDHFESWAYVWALVFPGAIGLGMIVYGLAARRPGNVRTGIRLAGAGLVISLLGAAFFEGVIGIGGYQFDRTVGVALGALIIVLGALLLILNLTSSRRQSR